MEGVQARNRDHVDVQVQQVAQDRFVQHITRGLDYEVDAAIIAILFVNLLERGIEYRLSNWIKEDLAARQNDASRSLAQIVLNVQVGQPVREVADDPPKVGAGFGNDSLQLVDIIRAKAVLVTVRALPVTQKGHHIVDGFHRSKNQLYSKLDQPWVSGPNYCTKSCAVADIAVRVHKLGVIEQVEEFGAELKLGAFADRRVLEQRKIEAVNPGTATDGSRRISDDAELSRLSKARRIKSVMIGTPRIELAKRGYDVWLARRQEGEAVLELEVGIGSDADGEAALKDRYS